MIRRVRSAALLLTATALVASCGETTPTGVRSDAVAMPQLAAQKKPGGGGGGGGGGGNTGTSGGVASCKQPTNGMWKQAFGPSGGSMTFGPFTLTVPAGALSARVTIQAKIPSGYSANFVQFRPDGLIFQQPASLTSSYSNCSQLAGKTLKVAQVSDSLQIIQYLPSAIDSLTQTVTGSLPHFSNYAVAW